MAVDREKILQTAQKHVDKKRFDKAIVELRKLVADDPADVRTLLRIGDLHLKLEQFEDAIATYEQVGDYYYREGFSVKAIAVYKQIRGIIRKHAEHLEGRYGHIVPRLAEIYTQLGLTSDALAAYDEVATRLRAEGRERDALDIFRKVVELDPQNPIAHLRVADSRARLGDMDKAVERFGEAARIMVGLGRIDDALKVLERLLEYRQDTRFARMAAELYLDRGQANDGMAALKKLQVAFKANPRDLETLAMLARSFDTIGQPKKALEVLKESARIAKDAGDLAALNALLETLRARAPEDTLVGKLDQWRASQQKPESARPAVAVDEVDDEEVVIEESAEAIDEVFELDEDGVSVGEHPTRESLFEVGPAGEESAVRRLLSEADRQLNAGQLDQAIRLLRDGLRNLGGSGALRHKLSDLLLEAGDTAGAITEKLILAQELANGGSIEPALEMLDEVLLLQPDQPDAVQMRANLGFPPADQLGYDHLDAPLQSYDVESGGVEEALYRTRHHSSPADAPAAQRPAPEIPALDDPFGTGTYPNVDPSRAPAGHAPAGRAPAGRAPAGPPPVAAGYPATHVAGPRASFVGAPPPLAQRRPLGPPPKAPQPAPVETAPVASLDEDALDQAEMLAEAGRIDEARALLHAQLHALPNHPLILERLADLDAVAAHAERSQSGNFPRPSHAPRPSHVPDGYGYDPSEPRASQPPASRQQVSLHPPRASVPPHASVPPASAVPHASVPPAGAVPHASVPPNASVSPHSEQWSSEVDNLLDQVREGVRNQVAEGDSATHYDLGVAYFEMGLHSDAISELTLAARDPMRECVCLSLIGTIQLGNGDYDAALDVLHRALQAASKTREQELALAYEIANTYELKMMPEHALEYFDWLSKVDPGYDDPRGSVEERIHHLRTESGAQRRPMAPDAPDGAELGEAFDELFEEG